MIDVNLINGIALAFEGDAVYSMYIRRHLILKGMTKPNKLHQEATKYVSAKAQARLISLMLEEQVLTEKEEEIYKRGRNTNSHTKAKNADVVTYRMSTGFEAVMGYLHLTENVERLETIISWCIQKSGGLGMIAKELLDWFPQAQIVDQPVDKEGYLTLPGSSNQWVLLEESNLTEREKQLIALLTQQEQARSLNPWYSYLIEGKGQAPQTFKKIQLVYCHLSYYQQENLSSWLDMMRTLFPNCQTVLQVGAQDYVFVLQQDKYSSVRSILSDMIEAVEYDFGLRLSIMLGQVWSQTGPQALSDLIKAERDLFKAWWRQGHQGVHTFSQLYLWSMGERLVELRVIKEYLHQMILDQDQIQEIILSLWENSAVLTKTAQQLYLHRNSLQYKIDKWEELTGLQLKELTDLTLCYQLILPDIL